MLSNLILFSALLHCVIKLVTLSIESHEKYLN